MARRLLILFNMITFISIILLVLAVALIAAYQPLLLFFIFLLALLLSPSLRNVTFDFISILDLLSIIFDILSLF